LDNSRQTWAAPRPKIFARYAAAFRHDQKRRVAVTPLDEFDRQVTALLADRQLLTHAFYQRWSAGELAAAELTSYAQQYRHFEQALPGFLTATLAQPLPERARTLLAANLADETGSGNGVATDTSHLALFDRFAAAVGAEDVAATPATGELVRTYQTAASALDALGVLMAYESQAAAVAASKASGLGQYGVSESDASFWTAHAEVDVAHRQWALEALHEVSGGSIDATAAGLRRGADAWWAFLDEREAEAPLAA
jgi:pyrroloquinoline-quinone synthase